MTPRSPRGEPDGILTSASPFRSCSATAGCPTVPPCAGIRSRSCSRSGDDLPAVLAELRERGVQRVFIEGGPTIASAFLRDRPRRRGARLRRAGADRRRTSARARRHRRVDRSTSARRLDVAAVESLGDDLLIIATSRSSARHRPQNLEGRRLMFTGIVEEIGAVTAVEPSGDGVRLTVRAPEGRVGCRARRLHLGQRRVPDRRRSRRRLVHRRRHEADARHVDARRRRSRPRGQPRAGDRRARPARRAHRAGPHRRNRRAARGAPRRRVARPADRAPGRTSRRSSSTRARSRSTGSRSP